MTPRTLLTRIGLACFVLASLMQMVLRVHSRLGHFLIGLLYGISIPCLLVGVSRRGFLCPTHREECS